MMPCFAYAKWGQDEVRLRLHPNTSKALEDMHSTRSQVMRLQGALWDAGETSAQLGREFRIRCWKICLQKADGFGKPCAMLAASHPQGRFVACQACSSVVYIFFLCRFVDFMCCPISFLERWILWIWGRILFEGLMDDDSQETAGRKP